MTIDVRPESMVLFLLGWLVAHLIGRVTEAITAGLMQRVSQGKPAQTGLPQTAT